VNGWIEQAIPPPSWFWEMFGKIFDHDYGFWGAFMKVVIIAPVIEELIFRGVIMHGLIRNYSEKTAVFFSGLLFALFHLNPWQFPATFVLGLILGWLMVRSQNIFLCIAGHAINNLLVLLAITYGVQLKDMMLPPPGNGGLLVISFALLLFAVIAIYFITKRRYETLKLRIES
jgi:membrane protease YdiL (CAAX protease family)